MHRRVGDHAAASDCYNDALRAANELGGLEGTAVAGWALHERAATAEAFSGYHRGAVAAYTQALKLRLDAHGATHPDVATTLWHRGRALRGCRDDGAARRDFAEVLRIRKATLGGDHPSVATCQVQLAACSVADGRHPEAARLYDAARKPSGKAVPVRVVLPSSRGASDAPRMVPSKGVVSSKVGPAAPQARKIREARFGQNHPACGACALAGAEVHALLGDHERASILYAKAYARPSGKRNSPRGSVASSPRNYPRRGGAATTLLVRTPRLGLRLAKKPRVVRYHSFSHSGGKYRSKARRAWLACRYESLLRSVSPTAHPASSWGDQSYTAASKSPSRRSPFFADSRRVGMRASLSLQR